jgi:hypothetical protein
VLRKARALLDKCAKSTYTLLDIFAPSGPLDSRGSQSGRYRPPGGGERNPVGGHSILGSWWANGVCLTKSYGENPNILLASSFAAGWCGHLVRTVEITNGIHCRLDTLLCS